MPPFPESISLLLPTRQRPGELKRLVESAADTADLPSSISVITYIDDDDPSYANVELPLHWTKVVGPRLHNGQVNLSVKWNECWQAADTFADIFMHCGDDIVFRTRGWDTAVREAINSKPGKIAFVWCNDYDFGHDRSDFGTHGFVHRNWTTVVGRFVPPYFVSDFNDTWFNDVAEEIGVRVYLKDHLTEHMHYIFNKAKVDLNTQERLERHEQMRPQDLYNDPATQAIRHSEARRLRTYIEAQHK